MPFRKKESRKKTNQKPNGEIYPGQGVAPGERAFVFQDKLRIYPKVPEIRRSSHTLTSHDFTVYWQMYSAQFADRAIEYTLARMMHPPW